MSEADTVKTQDPAMRSRSAGRLPWWLCLLGVSALAFCISLSMSWSRMPVPNCHDEFSNLLVADTLSHGRLANQAPAIWQPFQSFHVLVNPSYSSKFPLGPGALLALGYWLFGTPALVFGSAPPLCAAAVTWAAAGCMPRRWAVLAGLLLAPQSECASPVVAQFHERLVDSVRGSARGRWGSAIAQTHPLARQSFIWYRREWTGTNQTV